MQRHAATGGADLSVPRRPAPSRSNNAFSDIGTKRGGTTRTGGAEPSKAAP